MRSHRISIGLAMAVAAHGLGEFPAIRDMPEQFPSSESGYSTRHFSRSGCTVSPQAAGKKRETRRQKAKAAKKSRAKNRSRK